VSRIDVVIPTYNGLSFLPEAIQSVLDQTHKELSVIVVDDGSTDGTPIYVSEIADPRIRYLQKENGGQASARNLGIRASDAPYVALLDADDVWYPHKLEAQLAMLERDPGLGLVHGFHDIIDADGNRIGELEHALRGRVFHRLLEGNFVNGSGSMVLIPRAVFDDVGLFREDFLIGEDWELWLRIARSYAVDYVPERLMAIRALEAGMQRNRIKMAEGRTRMFDEMTKSFALRGADRRRLAVACLAPAAYDYALAERMRTSLAVFRALFLIAPVRTIKLRVFRFYLWVLVMALKQRR
jgi:glycosyltransferase involved in cell wall biosynthesis